MKLRMLFLLVIVSCTFGCEKKITMAAPESQPSAPSGREETKRLEAYDPLGYGGKGVRNKLDQALDQNEKRAEQLEQHIDSVERTQ